MTKMKSKLAKGNVLPENAPAPPITPEIRRQIIAEAAYYRASNRGFNGGDPVEDWLQAEREIDSVLLGSGAGRSKGQTAGRPILTISGQTDRALSRPGRTG